MKNSAQAASCGPVSRIRQLLGANRQILEGIAYGVLSGVLSNSMMFKTIAPFGAAFCAAVPREYSLVAAVGAILGSLLSGNPASGMKYVVAVLLVVAGRYLLHMLGKGQESDKAGPVIALLAVGGMSLTMTAMGGMNPYDVILSFGEAVMAAGAAYFFSRSVQAVESFSQTRSVQSTQLPCLIVSFAILIMALSEWEIVSLSIGRMLAVVVILLCAYCGKESAGAICGITAGAAMSLVSGKFAFLLGSYGFGGMMAGVFSVFGKLGGAAAFILVNGLSAVLFGKEVSSLIPIMEVFCATVAFMLIPRGVLEKLQVTSKAREGAEDTEPMRQAMLSRLNYAAAALEDISQTTQKVSQKLEIMDQTPVTTVFEKASDRVCRHCGSMTYCWQSKYTDTMNAFNDMGEVLRRNGMVVEGDAPTYFKEKCCKLPQLLTGVNQCYGEYLTQQGAQRKVSHVRSVVTDQFEGLSMALRELSREVSELQSADGKLRGKVMDLLSRRGLAPRSVSCFEDRFGKMSVQAVIPQSKLVRVTEELIVELSDLCERDFDYPQKTPMGEVIRVSFHERAGLQAKFGSCQFSYEDSRLCGDSFDHFVDATGRSHLIMSDGMGTGGRAAIDSSMASSLLSRLVQAGFTYDAALKLVNSALLVKSEDESLATLDVACIDLYTGKTEFLKAGAAPSYVKRGSRCARVESTSLPAGILRGVTFENYSLNLREGDIVVMVSDGTVATGDDWILTELELYGEKGPQEIARKIADTARMRRVDGHGDDITVLVAKLVKCA